MMCCFFFATLACFALGLPGFSAFAFLTRVWQSMQDTRTMFLFYALENGVNIVLAVALFPRFGVPGLAAAYGAAYTVAALATLVVLNRRLPGSWLAGAGGFALRLMVAAAAMAVAVAATLWAVGAALPPGTTRSAVQLAVAVPVGARETCEELAHDADEVVCTHMPRSFVAVGQWYDDFTQTTDDEIRALLARQEDDHGQ